MTIIVASFTSSGVPATGLAATIRIRRTDTQALVVTDAAMVEVGDGGYSISFATVDGLDYSIRADGSSTLSPSDRYVFGSLSGTTEAELARLDDAITSRPTALQIDAQLSGTHGAGAWGGGGGLTAQQTRDAMKLAPSAGAPAAGSIDALVDAIKARVDFELARVHRYLGLEVGTPAVHTPTSVVAGSIAQTVGVVGPVVTKSATS